MDTPDVSYADSLHGLAPGEVLPEQLLAERVATALRTLLEERCVMNVTVTTRRLVFKKHSLARVHDEPWAVVVCWNWGVFRASRRAWLSVRTSEIVYVAECEPGEDLEQTAASRAAELFPEVVRALGITRMFT